MPKFSVTYEMWTHEDVEAGETSDRGYISEDVSLREAVRDIGHQALSADEWPVKSPRWLTNDEYDEDFRTGARESRSMHIPNTVTPSSRLRIARLLGVRR